ncbi:MAG: hypothetical protein LBG58_15595 [Planctomycetaceae bacterium]|jgi:hypothetical protein|nr:hypothetical protein [Planctomycetaceae bacterium]
MSFKNLLLIGCGPHARTFYFPTLKKLQTETGLRISAVVDLKNNQPSVDVFLSEKYPDCVSYYVEPSGEKLSEELTGMLYYAALRVDLDEYIPPLQPTIQDSTIILRSIVFHSSNGNKELSKRFENLLHSHPRFGKSFVLVASPETRLHRLELRISHKNDAPDDYIVRDDYPRFKAMEEHLIELAKQYFNADIIETDYLETPEISGNIIETIISQASIPVKVTLLKWHCFRFFQLVRQHFVRVVLIADCSMCWENSMLL